MLSDTGKPAEALKAYESALAIRQKLAEANPVRHPIPSDLAASHTILGNLLGDTGKPAEAMKAYEVGPGDPRSWPTPTPPITEFQAAWRAPQQHRRPASETGQPAEALKAYESALAIQQKLADANPSHPVPERPGRAASTTSAICCRIAARRPRLKGLRVGVGDPARSWPTANPTVTQFQSDLATAIRHRRPAEGTPVSPAEALKAFESALAIRQKLADANPTVTQFQSDLADSLQHRRRAAQGYR